MGTPTVQDFKSLIKLNLIKDNEVTTENAILAEKIHSSDVGSLEGKSVRSKPAPITDKTIEILDELININQELKSQMDCQLIV